MEVCELLMPVYVGIIIGIVCLVAGVIGGIAYRKRVAEREIASARSRTRMWTAKAS